MAFLTEAQAELLAWIIESASGAVLFTPMLSEPDSVIPRAGAARSTRWKPRTCASWRRRGSSAA